MIQVKIIFAPIEEIEQSINLEIEDNNLEVIDIKIKANGYESIATIIYKKETK